MMGGRQSSHSIPDIYLLIYYELLLQYGTVVLNNFFAFSIPISTRVVLINGTILNLAKFSM